ncbi:MAG TPA: alpha/beta fold hydrolase [Myxococcales bacterium]|nr:alpha/beta fold hydrolase [Myxococcales bacterium]
MSQATSESGRRVRVGPCEIRYERMGAGTPVVLIHTLRTQLEYYRPLLQELAGGDLEIVAIDLPGHGHSSAPAVEYTAGFFTDAVGELLDQLELSNAVIAGESIGASIGLGLAARGHPRVARVVAFNPYDYGKWGGIRRSSGLANVLFTAMLWPGVGSVVARAGTRGVMERIMAGGLHDSEKLPPDLVDALMESGTLPGHARAFRSLCLQWRSWIEARAAYPSIRVPVTLVYGEHDWSRPEDRDANARDIPGARREALASCGHFSWLEATQRAARIIREASA